LQITLRNIHAYALGFMKGVIAVIVRGMVDRVYAQKLVLTPTKKNINTNMEMENTIIDEAISTVLLLILLS
jgi:cytochrome b subunit of formate dehydrogenase